MKNILKIILVTFVTLFPTLSQAQITNKEIVELAEKGVLTKEEAKTAIDKNLLHRFEIENAQFELAEERIDRSIAISTISIVAICAITIVILTFRHLRKKDEREKDFIMSLADKGVLTQTALKNIDTIIPQKKITDSKKFMTDATLIGLGWAIGYSIANSGMDDIFITPANILLALGIMRIIVRTIIFTIEIINRVINKKKVIKEETSNDEITNDTLPEER